MSEEELNEAIEYNLEYMEAMQSEEIFGGDYISQVKLKYANKDIDELQKENQRLQQENKQLKEEKQNVINYIVKELVEINKHQYAKGSRRLKKILELLGDNNE